jgi:hypothetical protein
VNITPGADAFRFRHYACITMKQWIPIGLVGIALTNSILAATPKSQIDGNKPLTYANVVSYFKETHLRATEVQKRCTIFFEGEWKNANTYNYCVIMVENDDEDVQITFYLTDAHEMNWITEFIDSRFFANAEKQRLFDRVTRGRNTRSETIGRFKVDVNHRVPRHAEIIVLSFTPLQIRSS